ncbi:hypothetical protein G6F37_008676 [Rhizopus arrhizus]|nr:hypothetical protein G6F38_008827 [Rhizopus arrhizus]KAG1155292.1 hypothetical protein G6F37_008676 [Rhizopus arrhizus]
MGPRKPEVEFISLPSRDKLLDNPPKEAYDSLAQLANNALKSGPFSITFDKRPPHIACTGDVRDFLSYAPFWWPEDPSNEDSKYIRKDGARNPDIGTVKDQQQLESFAENIMYLCLGYYFFKEDKYAKHAISLLEIFFINEKTRMNPNLTYAQFIRGPQNTTKTGRGEGIVSARV